MHSAGSLFYLAITSSNFLFAHLLYANSPLSQPAHLRTPHNKPEESPNISRQATYTNLTYDSSKWCCRNWQL